MAMIEVKDLKKSFGAIDAVRGISFSMDKGEVLGFLGPNGAGKSTVMRMLTGFITPSGGTASIGEHDIISDSIEARKLIGYLPETSPVYSDMTTSGFLKFVGKIRGLRGADLQSRIEYVIEICHLKSVRHQLLDTLSKGFRRRVGLAQALIHDPPVLVMDEPTDGLDPNQKYEVRMMIKKMAADKCIIISTHILEEVDSICTRAIIISEGKLLADSKPEELRCRAKAHGAVRLTLKKSDKEIRIEPIERMPEVSSVEKLESENGRVCFRVFPKSGRNITQEVLALLRTENWEVEDMHIERGQLDEVFRDITQGGKLS